MKKTIIIISIFSISIVLLYGIFSLVLFETSAKYTNYNEMNHYYKSNNLYISSNSLSNQTEKYNIINHYNYEDIDLEINNYLTDNEITTYNIEYELICNVLNEQKNYYDCIIDDKNNNKIDTLVSEGICKEDNTLSYEECISSNNNYIFNKVSNKHTIKLIKKEENNYEKVEVELILNTKNPFNKKLESKYIFNINESTKNITLEEPTDYNYFCKYIINNNYDVSKKIQLNIDTNNLFYEENDNIFINEVKYSNNQNDLIDKIEFVIDEFSSQEINVNKKDFNEKCTNLNINYQIIEE